MESRNFQIDTHVHIMTNWRIQGLARWMRKAFPQHPVEETVVAKDLVDDLKKGGITHFFNLVYPLSSDETEHLNAFNLDFCRRVPGAIPFAGIHQDNGKKAFLAEKLLKDGAAGFKIHPFIQRVDPWDSRFDRFYAFLEDAGKPLFIHTGFEAFYGRKMPASELRKLLRRFPALPVVFVHMAYPELESAFNMLDEFPNLYLDATGVFVFLRHSFRAYRHPSLTNGIFERLLEEKLDVYADRIFFGSDHPVGWGNINKIFSDLSFLPVRIETRKKLMAGSAMAFIDKYYPGVDWGRNLRDTAFTLE